MKRLILAGGGHSHIEVLRRFAAAAPRGVDLTIITPSPLLLYTGMWPGWVAGIYTTAECVIDVERLARAAGCAWIKSSLVGIDPDARLLRLADGSEQQFDYLSLDIGSIPPRADGEGAARHGVAVKPLREFADWWNRLLAEGQPSPRIGVVGLGAGGVELALAMESRLRETADGKAGGEVFLLGDSDEILPGQSAWARRWLMDILSERGITVHTRTKITEVQDNCVRTGEGRRLDFDHLVWATGAAPESWVKRSGLSTDERGFIAVNAALQSLSHPQIFAAGDIATQLDAPRPKSGVFAVKQGPVLAENLRRMLTGEPLLSYQPPRYALALIGTGEHYAVASRGRWALRGEWVWRWKQEIDREFVARYR